MFLRLKYKKTIYIYSIFPFLCGSKDGTLFQTKIYLFTFGSSYVGSMRKFGITRNNLQFK